MSEEQNNIVPDFDFEVDSPVLEDIEKTEELESTTSPEEEEEQNTPSFSIEDPLEQEKDPESKTEEENFGDNANPDVVAAYKFYKDQGIIKNDYEDFDGSPESLQTILRKEDENKYNDVYNYLYERSPEFAQPLLELILNKGSELTPEEALEIFEISKPAEFKSEDLDDEGKAADFLKSHYMETYGDTAEEAEERIDILKDRDKLSKEAKIILDKEEDVKRRLAEAKVTQAKEDSALKQQKKQEFENAFLSTVKESPWRDDLKQEVVQELYTGQFKKRITHIMNNPNALTQLVHFMKYYDGKEFKLDRFEKAISSRLNNKRKKNIQNYWSNNVGSGGRVSNQEKPNTLDLTNYEIEL